MKSTYAQLSDDMQAACDTGNVGDAKLVRKLAEDALLDGQLTIQQRADIEADFDTAFPDEI